MRVISVPERDTCKKTEKLDLKDMKNSKVHKRSCPLADNRLVTCQFTCIPYVRDPYPSRDMISTMMRYLLEDIVRYNQSELKDEAVPKLCC